MAHSDTWILVCIERSSSRLNGGDYWRLTWYDCDTGETYDMTVDPSYGNWRNCNWDEFVKQQAPHGVYENIHPIKRRTSQGWQRTSVPVASADYAPILIERADIDTLCEVVQQLEAERSGTADPLGHLLA